MIRKFTILLSLSLLSIAAYAGVTLVIPATASGSTAGFEPGHIISDHVMRNSNTMTTTQIQNFLNSKMPSCDTQGAKMYSSTQTRKQYAASRGVSTPFTCLKDYTVGGKSAAQIIKEKSDKYSINPQVLIVLLQKEQALVTDDWPWPVQYRTAAGYGCPDTAPCDSQYYGLANQLDWAAKMFQSIVDRDPNWYSPYIAGYNPTVYWHPDTARCGSQSLNIQNWSTASLYSYTPYRPNQAALNAGYGEGNSCSAYGNRNFFLYFKDWFGSPSSPLRYQSLDTPRWMEIRTDNTRKYDLLTLNQIDNSLSSGQQIFFTTKATVSGNTYLRTQFDTQNAFDKGIRYSDLQEISLNYTPLTNGFRKSVTQDLKRVELRTNKPVGINFAQNQQLYFTSRVMIGGSWYYVRNYDAVNGYERGIHEDLLIDSPVIFSPLETLELQTQKNIRPTDMINGQPSGPTIPKGTRLTFDSKTTLNGSDYYRTTTDTSSGKSQAIPLSALDQVSMDYEPLLRPRLLVTNMETRKTDLESLESVGSTIKKGAYIYFDTKVTINGIVYLRTSYDTIHNQDRGIPYSSVNNFTIQYVPLDRPRELTLRNDTRKTDLSTGLQTGKTYPRGLKAHFSTKYTLNGVTYLRSTFDTSRNWNLGIPYTDLR